MNKVIIKVLNNLRSLYFKKYINNNREEQQTKRFYFDYSGQEASNKIKKLLAAEQPCMICRFGSGELSATVTYLNIIEESNIFAKSIRYIKNEMGYFWWDEYLKKGMSNNAGFFPVNNTFLQKFGKRMIEDIGQIDILGSWLDNEKIVEKFMPNAQIVPLNNLEPYYHINPWSEILKDKKVLVIHPFVKTIKDQYKNRQRIFKNKRILPDFKLKTIKAVQSIANNQVDFANWFQALDFMCDQVESADFDIAIIGAGAYGLPLASFIKQIGKKAVHLGGATQIMFGIKGSRWDNNPFFQKLYNDSWVRPDLSEKPTNFNKVESGCYW